MTVFRDHRGRRYSLEGGFGNTVVRGTRARVWIMTDNREGKRLWQHSIRLDLHTARELRLELDRAIARAEREEQEFLQVFGEDATG